MASEPDQSQLDRSQTGTEVEERPKRFSMVRSLAPADYLTLGNAACGTASIMMCLSYLHHGEVLLLQAAFALLPVALVLDYLDGAVARRQRRPSRLGAELDSLADIVSFGVAPAVLGHTLGMRGGWDVIVLIFFVTCGISRLARFNVTSDELADASGKVRYFEGTPIPTSILLVGVLALAAALGAVGPRLWLGEVELLSMTLHPLSLMYAVLGGTMVSARLRIPKI